MAGDGRALSHLLLFAAVLILPAAFGVAEGVMEGGWAREDFDVSCASCHGATPEYPVLGAKLGYEVSGHKNNDNSYYANGGGCQKCHTNEGFITYVETGQVDSDGYVAYPSQPNCVTCHTMHETWDFSLRTTSPVILADGSLFDIGDGNLCANCHQARGAARAVVQASPARDVRSHWGAHHGPQSDVVNGTNAYEYPGNTYSSSPHKDVLTDGCVTCHMSLPEGRYGLSPEVGGHSFNVAGEVHHEERVNVSACTACHEGIGQLAGTGLFDIKAKADYDRDGTVEPLQIEVQGLLDALVNANGTGYLQTMDPPMYSKDARAVFEEVGSGWANSRNGKWNEAQMGALYNYKLFVEDRSKGVHNATYTIQVLYDTLKALDPRWDDSLRP
jgi:hypothetical protein